METSFLLQDHIINLQFCKDGRAKELVCPTTSVSCRRASLEARGGCNYPSSGFNISRLVCVVVVVVAAALSLATKYRNLPLMTVHSAVHWLANLLFTGDLMRRIHKRDGDRETVRNTWTQQINPRRSFPCPSASSLNMGRFRFH